MPFAVITLKKVPNSLRGDLTRWMQEISAGVYVGNFNTKVREFLWKRVTDTVGEGEATMCYSCRNEIGYSFCTWNTERQVVDYDGIPLVLIPAKDSTESKDDYIKNGFSDASRYHNAKRTAGALHRISQVNGQIKKTSAQDDRNERNAKPDCVFLDIETTGLNVDRDQIIEIGVIRESKSQVSEMHKLIKTDISIPDTIHKLTGISGEMLKSGETLKDSMYAFRSFIKDAVLIGYNISFDIKFLNKALEKYDLEPIYNKTIELMNEAKKRNGFQANYKFETTLKEYGIDTPVPHRALEDAKLIQLLYHKMGLQE